MSSTLSLRHGLSGAARLLLIVSLLAGTLPTSMAFPAAPPALAASSPGPVAPPDAGPETGVAAPPLIPSDLSALPELTDKRTANSTVYRAGADRYVALLSTRPLHYLGGDGAWQPIDASFRAVAGGYVVDRNSVQSRAGAQKAWLSASSGEIALEWQADSVGVADAGGAYTILATALDAPLGYATQNEAGTILLYHGGWSDPAIGEEIVSAAGSVEHALVLDRAPAAQGEAPFLVMLATLQLLPGAELWADGLPVTGQAEEAATLEVRDARGRSGLVLAPVRAFEAARPEIATSGWYSVRPGDRPGAWVVGVRTDLAWWLAPERAYPAVLDPVITVQSPTGWGEGLAWVRSTGDKAYTLGEMRLGAHLPDYNTESRGYIQFNSLPALLTNATVKVSAASLDVEPTDLFIPKYSYKGSGFTDWDSVAMKREATLAYVGACPASAPDPSHTCFSLQDDRLTNPANYNWDNQPAGVDIDTQTLKVGPIKTSGNANPTVTTWDVTTQIQGWYASWLDKPNPRPGPTFQLRVAGTCPKAGPYVSGFINGKPQFDSDLVPQCNNFYIPPDKVSLRIEYTELPVSIGANLLNMPGVPSYTPMAASSNNLFLTPNHQYKLAPPSAPARWRAVALRGNHAYTPALPAWATLKLMDYTGVTGPDDEPVQLLNPKAQGADKTTFFFIDDHLPGNPFAAADLRAEVIATADNDFPSDQNRNYRLQYPQSSSLPALIYGDFNQTVINLPSDQLITVREFHLVKGDNAGITVTAPISVDVALITPATADTGALMSANHPNVNLLAPAQPGGSVRTFSFSAPETGEYAVAIINQARPVSDTVRHVPTSLSSVVRILACPEGSYPTAKYKCQPLVLPDSTTPPNKPVSIPGGGALAVYSEGGFTAGADWCTANESAGVPIIGPNVGGRWVAVVQGSVCYQAGVLTTTPDSAIGLIVATGVISPSGQHGQIKPVPIYGDSMLLPVAGQPDGEVTLAAGGLLQPNADTIRRIQPFEQYWKGYYGHDTDYISTADMKSLGRDVATANVTVDAAGTPLAVDWTVAWSLYPFTCASCASEWTFVDDPAVPSVSFPLELDLASTTLRMLNSNVVDGRLQELDAYEKVGGPVAFQFHNTTSRLTVGPLLGGTTKPVHTVVQPPAWPRAAEGQGSCENAGNPTSCLDIRRGDYLWQPLQDAEQNVLPWSLPDLHIETQPASVAFSRAGQLNIFSTDHPASVPAFAQTFSFDTWEAGVHVAQEKCIDTDPAETTVIRGNSYIALPTLGDDGSGPMDTWVKAAFRLCQTSLQQAHLEFGVPKPGVPVGSTGFGVSLLDGDVTIDPNTGDTRITLSVEFQTLDKHTLTDGKGTVTLDTAGMLSLQATGKLVGKVNIDEMRLDVAWNPLDVLAKGQVSYGSGLLSGGVSMHSWIGQGWQGKYAWLPPNDEFHFTGSVDATVHVKSGSVVDDWPFVLPPFGVSLTAIVSFGEFCTSASCTSYDWGMSAAVKVLGYPVGVYVDSGGPDLILGSSSHKLIDQAGSSVLAARAGAADVPPPPILYPGTNQVNLTPAFSSPFDGAVSQPAASVCSGTGTLTVECPFTVTAGTGRALFTISWENGDLAPVIIKPNGTPISSTNALANGAEYTAQPPGLVQVVSYSVVTPTSGLSIDAGVWKVRLSNVGVGLLPGLKNNYTLLFASDPPAATLTWSPPQEPSPTVRRLIWSASRGGAPLNPDLEVEFFAIPATQKPVTPTQMAGTTIVQKRSANSGLYDWDLAGLAAGAYAFGARIDDHATGNGHIVVWSPYTVTLTDTTPPPVPVIAGQTAYTDTLIVSWTRDDVTPDLAGYLVEYTIPDWDLATPIQKVRRVLPSKKSESPLAERVRLGGLFLSLAPPISTTVCVRSYDASGNVSGCTPTVINMPDFPDPLPGPVVVLVVGSDGTAINVSWEPPLIGPVGGSAVDYRPAGCLLPRSQRTANEGASPLLYRASSLSTQLTGLTPGQVYEVGVRVTTAAGQTGPRRWSRVMHINPADVNGDGIPDQWEALYGVTPDTGDLDGDGLSDLNEFTAGSNPRNADSDGDGAYDAVEVEAGTDPCDPGDRPRRLAPRLALVGDAALRFTTAANLGAPEPQFLSVSNDEGGALSWQATPSAAWIRLEPSRGTGIGGIGIGVDPSGLAPGLYTGVVTVTNISAAARLQGSPSAQAEATSIPVTMLVLPQKEQKVYLPVAMRQAGIGR